MIERKFIKENLREAAVREFITNKLKNVGHSHTKIIKTPLGEKIVVYASRPGLIVGRKGATIKELTQTLKSKFKFENPQIEIEEVSSPDLDSQIVAERIASTLERFGSSKFKGVGHKVMGDIMKSGALGVEIRISGKIPGSRAKTWRFYQGYLKKCGNISVEGVKTAFSVARLKTGTVGIRVKIMPGDVKLPDKIEVYDEPRVEVVEEKKEEVGKKKGKPKKKTAKRTPKKPATKKIIKKEDTKKEEVKESKENTQTEEKKEQTTEVKDEKEKSE